MTFAEPLRYTPSIDQLVDQVVIDLAEHNKNVLIVLPKGVSTSEIWELVRIALSRRYIDIYELPLNEYEGTPLELLGEYLEVAQTHNESWQLEPLLDRAAGLRNELRVSYLDQLDQLAPEVQKQWLDIIRRWVNWTHTSASRQLTALPICVVVQAESFPVLPKDDVYLAVYQWWGNTSCTDSRVLLRQSANDRSCLTRWREHVLPNISGGDSQLTRHLWEDIGASNQFIIERLKAYAEERGWTKTELLGWDALEISLLHGHYRDCPPHVPQPLYKLWASGALQWSDEHGLELHSAALACLGCDDILRYRLWRGQMPLVLSTVNHIRLSICEALSQEYDRDWPLRWRDIEDEQLKQELGRDPNVCEFPELVSILERCAGAATRHRWHDLARKAKAMRNTIAHYRPVEFPMFQELWNMHQCAQQSLKGAAKRRIEI